MDMKAILAAINELQLAELGPLFEHLRRRVQGHRRKHGGYVPKEIFADCLGIGGVYPCVEVVVALSSSDREFKGFALKKRDPDDQGWEGLHHVTGQSCRVTDKPADLFARLTREIFGEGHPTIQEDELDTVGMEIHDEPERADVVCYTLVYLLWVESPDNLQGDWRIFTLEELEAIGRRQAEGHTFATDEPNVVDHHLHTLAWTHNRIFGDEDQPFWIDLRKQS